MSTKHTAGPWQQLNLGIYDADRRRIAVMTGRLVSSQGNADLIVKAPELLAALKDALRALTILDPHADTHDAQRIEDVIAKAEGRK